MTATGQGGAKLLRWAPAYLRPGRRRSSASHARRPFASIVVTRRVRTACLQLPAPSPTSAPTWREGAPPGAQLPHPPPPSSTTLGTHGLACPPLPAPAPPGRAGAPSRRRSHSLSSRVTRARSSLRSSLARSSSSRCRRSR